MIEQITYLLFIRRLDELQELKNAKPVVSATPFKNASSPKETIPRAAPTKTSAGLVAAGEYLRERHPKLFFDEKHRDHFHSALFHGFDFDNTMLRIASMNLLLHGVESPDIRYRDSLAQDHTADAGSYSIVLANPPFAGSLDYENTAKDLLAIVKTKKPSSSS